MFIISHYESNLMPIWDSCINHIWQKNVTSNSVKIIFKYQRYKTYVIYFDHLWKKQQQNAPFQYKSKLSEQQADAM